MSKVVPDGWNKITIDELGHTFNGLTKKTARDFGRGEYFLNYLQVFNNTLSDKSESGLVEITEGEKQSKVCYGDILFTTSSETPEEIGFTSVFLDKDWTPYLNSFCFGIRPKTEDLLPEFANYLFRGDQFRQSIQPLAQGSTRFNLSKGNLKKLEICFPPLLEQQQIASILTSVDEVIERTQSQIHKLQDLKKGTRNELLTRGIGHTEFKDSPVGMIPKGWEVKRLGEVSKVFFSNVDKKSHPDEIPVFLCNYMDVYNNSYIRNGLEFMPATAKQREIDKFLVKQGDVIITKDSETPDDIAVSAYVSEDLDNVLCGYHLALIRADNRKLYGGFLSHLFGLDAIQHHYYQLANGSTRFGLTSDVILDSRISIPPLPEQQKIASILSSMDTNIEEKQNKLQQTKSLKKSLMQDLLTGKVRVSVH